MVHTRVARLLLVQMAVASLLLASGPARTATEHAQLTEKMKALREEETGGVNTRLTVRKAQEIARRLKEVAGEIEKYQDKGLSPKLDATLARVLLSRAVDWNKDRDYPLVSSPENSKNEDYIRSSSIKGERVLVCASATAEWRWRIIVTKQARDDSRMTRWIVDHAKAVGPAAWGAKYGGLDHKKALGGSVPGWDVHHETPLYVGTENGGVDSGDADASGTRGNYRLVKESVHKMLHGSSGACRRKWGSPRLYVLAGSPTRDVDDSETGDEGENP